MKNEIKRIDEKCFNTRHIILKFGTENVQVVVSLFKFYKTIVINVIIKNNELAIRNIDLILYIYLKRK